MLKRIIKISICIIAVIVCACTLAGCTKYNAKMDSFAKQYISEEFLKENKVGGAWYQNEDYIEGVNDWDTEFYYDETSPKTRTFIITEKEEFDKIFTKYNEEINFDKKMVILHIFSARLLRKCNLRNIEIEEKSAIVNYKYDSSMAYDAVAPYQRCLMVILDKQDIETVEFIKK